MLLKLPAVTAAVCASLMMVGTAVAQADQSSKASRPGVWHKGRYLGYVPAHERGGAAATPGKRSSRGTSPTAQQDERDQKAVTRSASYTAPEVIIEGEPEIPFGGFDPLGPPVATLSPRAGWPVGGLMNDCRLPTLYGSGEYLLWWTRGQDTPALATTSPSGTARAQAGVLGQSGTSVLFGGQELNDESRSGGRFTLGTWLTEDNSMAIEAIYLFLDEDSQTFGASQQDFSILARPFFNTVTGAQDARQIVFPDVTQGSLNIDVATRLQSFEVLMRRPRLGTGCRQVDFLIGYRIAQLEDGIQIRESSLALSGATAGSTISLVDQFDTQNTFQGPEFGMTVAWPVTVNWSAELVAKVAVGITDSNGSVAGLTTTVSNNVMTTNQAGLLTQDTNIGNYSDSSFSSLGEVGIKLRRDFCSGITATCGYSFLYWSDVMRAGDQIDSSINVSQIPPSAFSGAAVPQFPLATTGYWAHGLTFGLECRY